MGPVGGRSEYDLRVKAAETQRVGARSERDALVNVPRVIGCGCQ